MRWLNYSVLKGGKRTAHCLKHCGLFIVFLMLCQATDQPVVPREDTKSMFQPLNLVIPFTVQQGELRGNIFNHSFKAENVTSLMYCFLKCTIFVLFAGEVRMPSGKTARPFIRDNKDGTVTVQFQPTERPA